MSLNNKELSLFVDEFKKVLPVRIEKLYIPQDNILILTLYGNNSNIKFKKMLLIETSSDYCGVYFIKKRTEQLLKPSIQNKFRNLLTSAIIVDIKKIDNDRILELYIKIRGEEKKIILELTGRHGNIFIVNKNLIEAILLNKKDLMRELSLYNNYLYPKKQISNKTLSSDYDNYKEISFLNYLENIYAQKIEKLKQNRLDDLFFSKINKKIKKLNRKKEKLKKDLSRLNSYKDYKKIGELLKANLYLLKRGLEFISVADYYDPDMKKIEIKLDKTKTPIQNMEQYFKKYDKFKRGVKFIEKEFIKIDKEILLLEKRKLEDKKDYSYLHKEKISVKKRVEEKHFPYKVYQSSNSKYKILVGKTSSDNDYLTFKVASGNDIWLHVISYSGSHVVIKKRDKKDKIDINTIIEAAHFAILNSKAPNDDKVEVCYTFRKFVKKPPKSKPGAVIYSQEKRVYIKLDMEIIKKIKQNLDQS